MMRFSVEVGERVAWVPAEDVVVILAAGSEEIGFLELLNEVNLGFTGGEES